jgi:hypothetical protein
MLPSIAQSEHPVSAASEYDHVDYLSTNRRDIPPVSFPTSVSQDRRISNDHIGAVQLHGSDRTMLPCLDLSRRDRCSLENVFSITSPPMTPNGNLCTSVRQNTAAGICTSSRSTKDEESPLISHLSEAAPAHLCHKPLLFQAERGRNGQFLWRAMGIYDDQDLEEVCGTL